MMQVCFELYRMQSLWHFHQSLMKLYTFNDDISVECQSVYKDV